MAWTKTKITIVAGVVVLLAAGTTPVIVKALAAHRPPSWQEKYDPSALSRLPPQITILPSLPSTVQSHLHVRGARMGLGQSVGDLLRAAYWVQPDRIIWRTPMPAGEYDILANLPGDDSAAVRKTITKTFGLTVGREEIETNVLILSVQSPAAAGLRPAAGKHFRKWQHGYYSAHGQSVFALSDYLERVLGSVVVNQTKLKGDFDIDLKWDGSSEGLNRVLIDELGLQLTPDRQPVEFLVAEKAN